MSAIVMAIVSYIGPKLLGIILEEFALPMLSEMIGKIASSEIARRELKPEEKAVAERTRSATSIDVTGPASHY